MCIPLLFGEISILSECFVCHDREAYGVTLNFSPLTVNAASN
jgi:hypothetical protein